MEPNRPVERGPWLWHWHVPRFLKESLPRVLINSLRELKLTGRLLTPNFSPDVAFEPSLEDAGASGLMSIVIPIHDAPEFTRRCLASVQRYASASEIILVDDASNLAETLEMIRIFARLNGWKVVRHEKSLGHSEACRAGASLATRSYLCLLNSDTVVTPWCWRRVKEVFEQDSKVGVAGPSTSNGNPENQTLTLAADQRLSWNDNQICAFAKHLLTHCREPLLVDVAWVSGFAFFIRRSLWEQLGGFDHNLPDYGNEVELCGRITDQGYRIVWIRNSYIHHFGAKSYGDALGGGGILSRIRASHLYTSQKRSSMARGR
jgi:GT2 family glycosyltransferase